LEKRFFLAIVLSLVVLFGWMMLNPPPETAPPAGGAAGAGGAPASTLASADPSGSGGAAPAAAASGRELPPEEIVDDRERELVLTVGGPNGGGLAEAGHYRARFSNRGARLVELDLGGYYTAVGLSGEERRDPRYWLPLVRPVVTSSGTTGSLLLAAGPSGQALTPHPLDAALWRMEEIGGPDEGRGVRFTYGPGTGVVFTKEIAFVPGTWHLRVAIGIENHASELTGKRAFTLVPAGCVPAERGDKFYPEPRAVAVARGGDEWVVEWEAAPKAKPPGEAFDLRPPLAFAGSHNKYFAFFLRPADEASRPTLTGARWDPVLPRPEDPAEDGHHYVRTTLSLDLAVPAQGATNRYEYVVYAGPKSWDTIVTDYEPHEAVMEEDLSGFATFSTIGHGLLYVLGFFHRLTGNWGIAIILLTICVRGALFPVNRRSQTAMARYQNKMKRVQPRLDEIKRKHANDPKKLREAQAKIMQEEGAFPPLGGCLPMFAQIPIFLGLFSALRTSFDLRHAPFAAWITDLSRPDQLLELGFTVPIVGFQVQYLNLLPLLMVVLWIWQQQGMPKPADEQAARMQKMMLFMPVVFGFLLYNYAAGLSLYMITQSSLGIVEQKVIKKLWPLDDSEPERKKPSGCGPFAGMMERMAEKQREHVKRMEALQRTSGGRKGGKARRR